jgi:hypothetical protein
MQSALRTCVRRGSAKVFPNRRPTNRRRLLRSKFSTMCPMKKPRSTVRSASTMRIPASMSK